MSSDERFKDPQPAWPPKVRTRHRVQKRVEGTPSMVEAVFVMIMNSEEDTRAFRYGRGRMNWLNDDQLWKAYEAWHEGKVDPIIFGPKSEKELARELFGK